MQYINNISKKIFYKKNIITYIINYVLHAHKFLLKSKLVEFSRKIYFVIEYKYLLIVEFSKKKKKKLLNSVKAMLCNFEQTESKS